MRFVVIYLLLLFGITHAAHAGPEDQYAYTGRTLSAPDGFEVEKLQQRLPEISAITMVGNDLYATSKDGRKIVKLGDRDGDNTFDKRSTYLIGFTGLSDVTSSNSHLFIADENGVWRSEAGRGLVAATVPEHLLPFSGTNPKLAFDETNNRLFVSTGGKIMSLDLKSNTARIVLNSDQTIAALAVSPNGGLWAAINQDGKSVIAPIRPGSGSMVRLEVPNGATITDLMFWPKERFPDDWPEEWTNDLFVSVTGDQPMIGRARFNFGDIDPKLAPFINGFSTPSRVVGRRNVWAAPGGMSTFDNGRLLFAQKDAGYLWTLKSAPIPSTNQAATNIDDFDEQKVEKPKQAGAPPILSGSSITNVSRLESGSALENDELLRPSTQPEQSAQDEKD